MWWPMLRVGAWVKHILMTKPKVLLAGGTLSEPLSWQISLQKFWQCYREIRPNHDAFLLGKDQLQNTIPIMVHGDEGRGLGRKPFMVLGWQPMVSFKGLSFSNDSS